MSTRDIQDHIYDIYGYDISPESVSTITDTVLSTAKARARGFRSVEDFNPIIKGLRVLRDS
jgi:transposase-like protein